MYLIMEFNKINYPINNGKIYLAISKSEPFRKIFVRYEQDIIFTYFSIDGEDIHVLYPDDFHRLDDIMLFYEINLPSELVKKIQSYGTQYNYVI